MGVPLVCRCGNQTEASPEFLARHGLRCSKCRRRMMPAAWFEAEVRRRQSDVVPAGEEEDLMDGMDSDLLAVLEVGFQERASREQGGADMARELAARASDRLRPSDPPDPDQKARRLAGLGMVAIGAIGASLLSLAATATAYGFLAVMILLVCVLSCVGGIELVRRNGGV